MSFYKTSNVNDTELVYSLLKEKYPSKQIDIEFDYNTKQYTLTVTNKKFIQDPEIPVDVTIKVHYGDSVTSDTPLLLYKDGQVHIKTISSIFDESKMYEYPEFKIFDQTIRLEKQYSTTDYKVWSDKGWVNIKKVIRHKTDKKIYRVLTHTGCVDVTEDHSLINENYEMIKPGELKIGDTLLHSFPKEFPENETTIVKMAKYQDYILTEKEAEVWGFFLGDGYCKESIKNSWVLKNKNLNRLNYYKNILEKIDPNLKLEIIDTLKKSGVYQLVPIENFQFIFNKYHSLFYNNTDSNYKQIPNCILNASISIKKAFFKGYYDADGYKTHFNTDTSDPKYCIKGKITAQCLYYLTRSIGFNIGINIVSNPNIKNDELFFFEYTNFKQKKETEVKKIVEKRKVTIDEFVYDLETEIGRFGCGVGQLQNRNTDSIFLGIKYNREDYKKNRIDTFKLGTLCGDKLTHEVFNRPPIEMEFEKVFQPFILLSKKRYIGRKYDNMKDPFEMTKLVTSGIALTRRDYCKMVKNCYKSVIDVIVEMKENNLDVIDKGIEIFKKYINDIIKYNIPFDDLIVSALLAKSYKTRPVHLILAEKLKERNEEVQIGDRIPYIYIEDTSGLNKMKSELGEDPEYAKTHNLKFNRLCYLEQLAKPLLSFFCIVLKDFEDRSDELINYVNQKITSLGGKKLKESDFKLFLSEE